MTVTAEVPLIGSATALAIVALLVFVGPTFGERGGRNTSRLAIVVGSLAVIVPLIAAIAIDPAREAGQALWEWSAAGGPTIQASYRFDGVAAIGVAVGTAYTVAGLIAAARARRRNPLLPSAILAIGLVFIALAVTEDLVACIVVLGVMAPLTVVAALSVATLPATSRLAAYFAAGIQFFVLAALLVSRYGGGSFRFDAMFAGALSPGTLLTASIGAALFAGLYPFVPWRFERALVTTAVGEPIRGIVTMPAGVAATLVLFRIIGVTRGDVTTIPLPNLPLEWRAAVAIAVLAVLAVATARRRSASRRMIVIVGVVLVALAAYPALRWSHIVLAAALVSVLYAATVSLALPAQWPVVRYDVTLAAAWIGLALGTPIALAGVLIILATDAATVLAEAAVRARRRTYLVVSAGATAFVAGLFVIALGALEAGDPGAQVLAIAGIAAIGALTLVHVGRRLELTTPSLVLDAVAVVAALGSGALLALALLVPIDRGVTIAGGRPLGPSLAAASVALPAVIALAALLVVAARSTRPFVPDLAPLVARLRRIVAVADPVPAGLAAFATLDTVASRLAATFALFEQRGGVWLATVLIVGVLVWSVR
ncbi:MAG TPA: hypothetical protein VF998_07090 [Candidatus Limnocylindria bacterium]